MSTVGYGSDEELPFIWGKDIRDLLESNKIPDSIKGGLTEKNYASYFKTLVMMEEIQLEEDMRSDDMECITMRKRENQFFSMMVPGVAERRPSLVRADHIFAKLASEQDDHEYQGLV
ncbi:putative RNA helicase SDE3 [Senna tora]|uniref:Putative RNA helicase SDE3 n=1 Tax=Senna tora TaxID=362788 RepID=A0A834WNU4_9FABA|nr:putative RNA helicase SDE3 [Senna tora]